MTLRGVTGLVYSGKVNFEGKNQSGEATKLFARFHPEFFTNYFFSLLTELPKENNFIDCNNIFYLKKNRFYYENERYIIPPKSFLGLSLSDDMYGQERLFVLTNGTLVDLHPHLRFSFGKQASLMNVGGAKAAELTGIYRRWLKALSHGDESLIRDYLSENSRRFAENSALFQSPILRRLRISTKGVNIKTDGKGHFVLSAGIVNHKGARGESRIIVSKINGRWFITTYSVNF